MTEDSSKIVNMEALARSENLDDRMEVVGLLKDSLRDLEKLCKDPDLRVRAYARMVTTEFCIKVFRETMDAVQANLNTVSEYLVKEEGFRPKPKNSKVSKNQPS